MSLKSFPRQHPYLFIFLFSLLMRLLYVAVIYEDAQSLIIGDSHMYVSLAEDYVKGSGFYHELDGKLVPETERVPIYILFLALHKYFFGEHFVFWSVISQFILDALSCVLIAKIAFNLKPSMALWAGLAAAVNPTMIIYSSIILTETPFTFFICLLFYGLILFLQKESWKPIILMAIALSLGTLTRPLLLLWPLVMLPILFVFDWKRFRQPWKPMARITIIALIFISSLAPWLIRNHRTYGTWSLMSQSGSHFLFWVLPLTWEVTEGIPWETGSAKAEQLSLADPIHGPVIKNSQNPFIVSKARTSFAFESLKAVGMAGLGKTWLYGAAMNLFTPSIIQSPPIEKLPRQGFMRSEAKSKIEKIFNFLFRNSNPLFGWILLLGAGGVLIVRLFQTYGLYAWIKNGENRIFLLFQIAWIGYILGVNGPVAAAKYRIPIEPSLCLLLAYALDTFWEKKRAQRSAR